MVRRRLGRNGLEVAPIGFGAVKIGRNRGVKYPHAYALPDDAQVGRLLHGVVDAGIKGSLSLTHMRQNLIRAGGLRSSDQAIPARSNGHA